MENFQNGGIFTPVFARKIVTQQREIATLTIQFQFLLRLKFTVADMQNQVAAAIR